MLHVFKRCRHCKKVYKFQASGICTSLYNDDTYCPDCKKIIDDALNSVPKKYSEIFVETDEVTYEYLKNARKEKESNAAICLRRVYPTMYNLKTGAREIIDAFDIDNKEYIVKYWSNTPEEITIMVLKEKNNLTGEITGYWHNY